MANILKTEKRVAIVKALTEGNSIRATSRMVGVSKNTVTKLLVELGEACSRYEDEKLRGLNCRRVQMDEIWSFTAMKEKTAKAKGNSRRPGVGDTWTWTAIDADTKLVLSWQVGPRTHVNARIFFDDLASRLNHRIQLSTDGLSLYIDAVDGAFGMDVDYAQIVKLYGSDPETQKAYSPSKIKGVEKTRVQGNPDPTHMSTSYVERQNLTMRMSMRRFTRLTNGFSKKLANHVAAIGLHYAVYNLVRPHGTLTKNAGGTPTTPAMAAGVATRPYSYEDVISLLESN